MSILPQLRPVEVADGVFQLSSLGARVTALVHEGDVLLLDTGARGSYPLVARSLARLGLRPDRVRGVVLTHAHPDHAGALSSVVAHTDAVVYLHGADAGALASRQVGARLGARLSQQVTKVVGRFLFDGTGKPATLVEHGAHLDWPDDVVVIHTPGHTPGSVSLYLPALRLIVVGDALQYRFRRLAGPARWVTGDYPQAIASMHRIAELDFETMVFSHFPPLRGTARTDLKRLLERRSPADV